MDQETLNTSRGRNVQLLNERPLFHLFTDNIAIYKADTVILVMLCECFLFVFVARFFAAV